jgi:hypothetical protein
MLKLVARSRTAWTAILLATTIAIAATVPAAPRAQTIAADAPRQVNVSADSTPGWVPSREQEDAAGQAATTFLALMDSGKAAEAYALLAEENRAHLPYADFSEGLARFNAQAGAVIERRQVVTTWTKDPPDAPVPGVYAAIDLTSRFARIDRHCGYLILYQPPAGGAFRVMRQEDSYMDNATARQIEQRSKAELDAAWVEASATCPNYAGSQASAPLPEADGHPIGYPTVAAALAALRKRDVVKFSVQQGWTIAEEQAAMSLWSFAPPGNPAYPSAVKRQVVREGDASVLRMSVLCEAEKAPCDALVRSFQALNAQMEQSLSAKP